MGVEQDGSAGASGLQASGDGSGAVGAAVRLAQTAGIVFWGIFGVNWWHLMSSDDQVESNPEAGTADRPHDHPCARDGKAALDALDAYQRQKGGIVVTLLICAAWRTWDLALIYDPALGLRNSYAGRDQNGAARLCSRLLGCLSPVVMRRRRSD